MDIQTRSLIQKAYSAFNSRDLNTALSTMHEQVHWPKSFEGGYVIGHEEVRNYWTQQWKEINARVEPISIAQRANGTIEVTVHQLIKDLQGNLILDGTVKYIYTLQDALIRRMAIELQ